MKRNTHLAKQKGMGALGLLTTLTVAGFALMTLFKLVPMYLEYNTLRTIIDEVAASTSVKKSKNASIRTAIENQLMVNTVNDSITYKDFKIVSLNKSGSRKAISIDYEKRKPWIANLNLVAAFEHSREIGTTSQ